MALYQVKDSLGVKTAVIHWDGVEPINTTGSLSPDDGKPCRGPIPESVTGFQIRAALSGMPGAPPPLQQVNTAFAAAGGRLRLAWETAPAVRRDSHIATTIRSTLGLTLDEFNNLFRASGAFEP
jgi:hypothetical protein